MAATSRSTGQGARRGRSAPLVAVLVALGLYLVLFYSTRLPSLERTGQGAFRRADYFWLLLLPEELLRGWCGDPPEVALADRVPVLTIALAIVGFAWLAGWLAMALCRMDRGLSRLEQFVFATAVGLNLVSTWTLAVGLAGLLCRVWAFILPGVAVCSAAGWVAWQRRTAPVDRGQQWAGSGEGEATSGGQVLSWGWLWAGLPFVAVIVLGGMLPPVDFDVREYHLQVPKEFYQRGRIEFLPHNVYGNMPMGVEMHSLLAMVLAGDWWLGALAGKTVAALFAPLGALALVAAGRRWLNSSAAVVAALAYVSCPWVVHVSTAGLIDGGVACYLFLAVYAMLLWLDRSGSAQAGGTASLPVAPRGRSALAGFLAGAAVATKYPAALFVLLPLAVVAAVAGLWKWRGRAASAKGWGKLFPPFRRSVVTGGTFLLVAFIGCGLWLAKNWVFTGNPTYPLLYEVFDGRYWSHEKNEKWNRAHRPEWPAEFSPAHLWADLTRVGCRSEWLSPLVIPLAALGLVAVCSMPRGGPGGRQGHGRLALNPSSRIVVVFCAAQFFFVIAAWWLFTHRIDRFWIPALPLACLVAGLGASWSMAPAWRVALRFFLVLALVSSFLVASTARPGVYNRYFVRLQRLRTHPERVDPWILYFNRLRPPGRVLLVGAAEVFDLEVPAMYNTVFDDCIFEKLVKGRRPEQVRAAFAARDITYLVVHWGEIARYRSPGNYGFTDFVQPDVLARLVRAGVLEPLPPLKGHPARAYRVLRAD